MAGTLSQKAGRDVPENLNMARRKLVLLTTGLLCLALAVPMAHGVRLYKWVDKDGKIGRAHV